jgi:hypothetical protein
MEGKTEDASCGPDLAGVIDPARAQLPATPGFRRIGAWHNKGDGDVPLPPLERIADQ